MGVGAGSAGGYGDGGHTGGKAPHPFFRALTPSQTRTFGTGASRWIAAGRRRWGYGALSVSGSGSRGGGRRGLRRQACAAGNGGLTKCRNKVVCAFCCVSTSADGGPVSGLLAPPRSLLLPLPLNLTRRGHAGGARGRGEAGGVVWCGSPRGGGGRAGGGWGGGTRDWDALLPTRTGEGRRGTTTRPPARRRAAPRRHRRHRRGTRRRSRRCPRRVAP